MSFDFDVPLSAKKATTQNTPSWRWYGTLPRNSDPVYRKSLCHVSKKLHAASRTERLPIYGPSQHRSRKSKATHEIRPSRHYRRALQETRTEMSSNPPMYPTHHHIVHPISSLFRPSTRNKVSGTTPPELSQNSVIHSRNPSKTPLLKGLTGNEN